MEKRSTTFFSLWCFRETAPVCSPFSLFRVSSRPAVSPRQHKQRQKASTLAKKNGKYIIRALLMRVLLKAFIYYFSNGFSLHFGRKQSLRSQKHIKNSLSKPLDVATVQVEAHIKTHVMEPNTSPLFAIHFNQLWNAEIKVSHNDGRLRHHECRESKADEDWNGGLFYGIGMDLEINYERAKIYI